MVSSKGVKTIALGPLFEGLIVIVVGLALLPVVTGSAAASAADKNASASVKAMAALLPLLYVILIVVIAIGFVTFRRKGGAYN